MEGLKKQYKESEEARSVYQMLSWGQRGELLQLRT